MPHETENPLIIDVVGEVEPSGSTEQRTSKKTGRSTTKNPFFKRDKASAGTTTTKAASEADVNAAKRAATAAAVPPVEGPASVSESAHSEAPQASQQQQPAQSEAAEAPAASAQAPVQQSVAEEARPAHSQPQPFVHDQQPPQAQAPVQPAEPPRTQPVVTQQPVPQPAQPAPVQPEQPVAQAAAPQAAQPVQPAQPAQPVPPTSAQPASPQPAAPAFNRVPPAAAPVRQGNMAAAVAAQPKSKAFFVFGILAVLVVVFALTFFGFYSFYQLKDQTMLVSTTQVDQESDEVKPIVSASLDQASKVSIRAKAEGWTEEGSTPAIAYIKRVENASDDDAPVERYFAFAPDKSASVSLPAGRYAFSFIAPMNSDGSLYSVPDMVDMVVGDGGMAVLPVDFTRIPKADATQEQISRALVQLKTASEKGDDSFDHEPFKKSIELALSTWFPQDAATEHPATDLTQEQQDSLNAQADSQNAAQSSSSSSSAAAEHDHDWIAQHEQRWKPAVVPVIDAAAWESPVYARYRCQEGILFETLDTCLAHVRERGGESYSESNEIIRIDYHPAVVHYEEQGGYENVVTEYRCSICGVRGTL